MANWLNRHVGEVVLATGACIVGALFVMSYQLGQMIEGVDNLEDGVKGNELEIESLADHLDKRLDDLERRIQIEQFDLKSVLLSTNAVGSAEEVFWAAVIDDAIWVFPDEVLRAKFEARGMIVENVNWFLNGYRMMPASPVYFEYLRSLESLGKSSGDQ